MNMIHDECDFSIATESTAVDNRVSERITASLDTCAELEQSKLVHLNVILSGWEHILNIIREQTASDVIRENSGRYGSLCFVVRRPGCELCRDEAWTLSAMTALADKPLDGFGLFGVVKEAGEDLEGLSKFQDFFPYPLYRDDDLVFYKALGFRKLKVTERLGPGAAKTAAMKLATHITGKKKQIASNVIDGCNVNGGIIFFGPDQQPLYIYEEQVGKETPVNEFLAVLDAIREEYSSD